MAGPARRMEYISTDNPVTGTKGGFDQKALYCMEATPA